MHGDGTVCEFQIAPEEPGEFAFFREAFGENDVEVPVSGIPKTAELAEGGERHGAQIGDGNPSVEELTEQALDMAALRRAMDQLEPQQRELLRMVYEERCSCASIARDEGVNPRTVRERLYRAQEKLKKIFK